MQGSLIDVRKKVQLIGSNFNKNIKNYNKRERIKFEYVDTK